MRLVEFKVADLAQELCLSGLSSFLVFLLVAENAVLGLHLDIIVCFSRHS